MLSKKILQQDKEALLSIKQIFDENGFQTDFFSVDTTGTIPILSIIVKAEENSDLSVVNMAFTPFGEEELEKSRLLQVSIILNVTVTAEQREDILCFANQINTGMALGHFTIVDKEIWYRYTHSLAKDDFEQYQNLLETVSLCCILTFAYERLFSQLIKGEISLEQAMKNYVPFL